MSIIKKYTDKLYLKQWGIGLAKGDIAAMIRARKFDADIQWLPLDDKTVSYADPFIFRDDKGQINILFENVSSYQLNGKISLMVCNDHFEPLLEKTVLDTNDHLSYPFIYKEKGKTYVFPENAFGGALNAYEFDPVNKSFINKREVIRQPLLDSTILKYQGRYWLFATLLGPGYNSDLHIFYSENLLGPYTSHKGNPVKSQLNGSRPAGNFIEVDGMIYRPAQNCANYYGESITINKINKLTEDEFSEEEYMIIEPDNSNEFDYGIHTINVAGDIIIVDGQKSYFQPVQQLNRKIKSYFH